MDSVTFVLPSIDASGMSKDEQGALIVNQATAVIVAAYLQYVAAIGSGYVGFGNIVVSPGSIGTLVDNVQNALRTF